MGSRAEYYFKMAADCADKAAQSTDHTARRTYEALSRQWARLARRAEQARRVTKV